MRKYRFIGNPDEYNDPSYVIYKGAELWENIKPEGWENDVAYHVHVYKEDWEEVIEKQETLDTVNKPLKDNINPNHYKNGKVECIDALESATINKKGLEAVCVANTIKYLWRYEDKNGLEDVKKAEWYLKRLIKHLENDKV